MAKTGKKGDSNIENKGKFKSASNKQWTQPKYKGNHGLTSKDKQKYAAKIKMQNKQQLKAEKLEKQKQEREKAFQEKQARIQAYKKKRSEKAKAISRRTHRGQPLMKDRMQLLLKQIEEMKRSS